MKLATTIDVALGRGQNMREHYAVRAKRVKAEREATRVALVLACGPTGQWTIPTMMDSPSNGARITLHRPWARVPLDSDNLSGAFKGVRDEVASFLGVDDRSERLHWIYTQSKQPKGTLPVVTIEVLPVADIDPQVKRVRELEGLLNRVLKEVDCIDVGSYFSSYLVDDITMALAPRIGGVPVLVDDNQPDGVVVMHMKGGET